MANPVVSVIVPLHNHENWIEECLYALAAQDYRPLRVVVVDDGSTDGGRQVVLSLLEDLYMTGADPARIARGVLRGTDIPLLTLGFDQARGPAFARNRGIEAAFEQTDIFGFCDSDDLYHPSKVSLSVRRFLAAPEVGLVYSDYDTFRADGLRLRQFKPAFDREYLERECIINCDSLVRKSVFERVGGFEETLRVAEDYDLWLRATEVFPASHVAESLVSVRIGPHSSTDTVPNEVWVENSRRVMARMHERKGKRLCPVST